MSAHQIRQQERQKWIRRQRQSHGPGFLPDQDDGTHNTLEDLFIFGYTAQIFPAPRTVPALTELSPDVFVDRYDIRHLIPTSTTKTTCHSISDHRDISIIRFATLLEKNEAGEEKIPQRDIFEMDAQERRAFIERAPQVEYKGIPLDYELQENPRTDVLEAEANKDEDEDEGEDENEPAFVVKFAVPDNVAMPKTQRLFGIIEQTARFIVEQPSAMANRMELVIQGKQGTNPDFAFLSARSPLYAFYKHLQWLMQTGLYGYNAESSSSSDSEQEKDQEQEQEQHPFAVPSPAPLIQPEPEPEPEPLPSVPSTVSVPTDAPTRQLIDTVALLMCKSPNPQKLEQTMRVEKATTSTYRFLSPFDPLHAYYCFIRNCRLARNSSGDIERAVTDALQKQQNDTVIVPVEKKEEEKEEPVGDQDACLQAKRRLRALEFLRAKRTKQ